MMRRGASGQDGREPVVELAGVVEDALAELVDGPDVRRPVREGEVAAGEDLVAVAGRVEEVHRLAAGDAVAGGADVDRDVVHGHEVCGAADLVPVAEAE